MKLKQTKLVEDKLGTLGSVKLTTDRESGRAVSIELELLNPRGQPLTPYAPPTLTVSNSDLSLGDATLTSISPGSYRAEPPFRLTASGAPRSASAPASTTIRSR
jgi:hypothetical protein